VHILYRKKWKREAIFKCRVSFYDQQGAEICLKQAHDAGADVYEFFPTEAMFTMDRPKILELKKLTEELQIEPVFTFVLLSTMRQIFGI
jgi:hypothetical protein